MKTIPFLSLGPQHQQIRSEIQDVLMRVYDKNSFVLGSELIAFENEFARLSKSQYSFGVGNGLDALSIALKSLDLKEGDEVIVPAHTYIATWLSVSRIGATLVPVEPNETLNIDPSRIENAITERTKVILAVHLFGQACDMSTIKRIAEKHNLAVVEDNAQAFGAKWDGRPTGSFGIVNATSFYPTKNLGALGDGGAITTSDPAKAAFIKEYRNYGFETKNIAPIQGVNSRLDEMQAAVLNVKLKYLDKWTEARRKIADQYIKLLTSVGDIFLPVCRAEAEHVYHLFVIQSHYRDQLKNHLQSRGIETMIHYPIPPHLQDAYRSSGFVKGDFPITENIAGSILSLPLWPGLTPDEIDYICDAIRLFYK